jgi:hypothetical protein
MKKLKDLIKLHNVHVYIYILCIAIIALSRGLDRTHSIEYEPMNGAWQNYNPIRRVLDGQIPFVDFVPYLGLGVIALNIIPLAFNNTFGMSMLITTFTATVCFLLLTLTIFYLSTKKIRIAMLFSAFSPLLLRLLINRGIYLADIFQENLLKIGNSARPLRSFLPIMLTLLLLLVMRLKQKNIFELFSNKKSTAIIGAICGFFILWSNDYGFCTVGAAELSLLMCLLYKKSKFKDIIISLLIFTASVLIGLLISAIIFTLGHPLAYLNTASGTAKYQYWYFNAGKISRITELIRIIFPLYIPVPIVCLIILYKFIKRTISSKDILLFFIITTAIAAALLYGFGSGNIMNIHLFYIAIVAILGWVIKPLLRFIPKPTSNILLGILLFTNIFSCIKAINNKAKFPSIAPVPYVSELGGYTRFGKSLYAAKEFLGSEKIFSTYASALENMTGQFQPTGTDYIIHVLGDKQREDYLNIFLKGNYRYAQTIRTDYYLGNWEKWVERANWFFYRELLNKYKPVMLTDYSVIWELCDFPQMFLPDNIETTINNLEDTICELLIDIKDNIDCIADVEIEYHSSYNNIFKYRINTFRKYLLAYDEKMLYEPPVGILAPLGCYWGIPDDKTSYYVPVVIKNGKGRIIILSNPDESTTIKLYGAKVIKLLPLNDPF